jgi:hypothetical protein
MEESFDHHPAVVVEVRDPNQINEAAYPIRVNEVRHPDRRSEQPHRSLRSGGIPVSTLPVRLAEQHPMKMKIIPLLLPFPTLVHRRG